MFVNIKPISHQQEQNLMDSGEKKVETRVEEPDWTDLSHSSKPGENCVIRIGLSEDT